MRNPLSLELHRRLQQSNHDIYHLHNPWFLPTLEAAHAVPDDAVVVQTVHSAQITSNNVLVRALNVGYKPLAQYIFDRVDHNFVQGATEKQRLLNRFDLSPDAVSVVPNGIYPESYDIPEMDIKAFCQEYELNPDVPTVLYVSRLIPEKNPDLFVEAVSEHLADRDLQAVLVGTGESEFVASVRSMADDRVTFLSNLEFEELKTSYHVADLFTFLGMWEGLPTVILEAMNARLPVISTPVGAIPDAVVDGEHGTMVSSPPEAREVATALRYYLDLPEIRAEVGERNRARVREEYSWDGIANDILKRYETTAGVGERSPI